MPDGATPEQLRAAASLLRTQEDELNAARTALWEQEQVIKQEKHAIAVRVSDLVMARQALEYKAGEVERLGNATGEPTEAVSALIEGALAQATSTPESATING